MEWPLRAEGEAPDVRHKASALSHTAAAAAAATTGTAAVLLVATRSVAVAVAVFGTVVVVAGGLLAVTRGGRGCRFVAVVVV